MSRDSIVIPLRQPEVIAREGARRMLAQVLIAETTFVAMWKDLKLPDGRDRVVRQGHGPHRDGHLGCPRRCGQVRDHGGAGT